MGVAEYQLVGLLVANIGHVEAALFLAYQGVETDMHQNVAKFLADVLLIVTKQCIAQLERLLYRVGAEALVGLLAVPWAFHTEAVKYVKQAPECCHFLFSTMCHCFFFILFCKGSAKI